MRTRKPLLGLVLLAAMMAGSANFGFAATQTLTGVVTDDMCGRKHTMLPGKPDADCVRECVKAGGKYALLVGDKLYILQGDAKQIDAVAGKRVSVTGELSGSTVSVASISTAK